MKLLFCVIIGSLFAVRMSKKVISLGYMEGRSHHFLFVIGISMVSPWLFVVNQPLLIMWVLCFVQYFGPMLFLKLIEHRRREQFHNETERFYDQLLMGVRSGNSIREVIRGILMENNFGFYTREIVAAVLSEGASVVHIKKTQFRHRAEEIHRVLHAGGRISDQLEALRRKYRMFNRFRRRSRLATQSIDAQIVVILVLYSGLLALRFSEDREILRSPWFFVSLFLVFAGVFVIRLMKRNFKWRI